MEKKIAKTDMTYCTNNRCKQKEDCFRCKENYYFNGSLYYSFCEFAEDYCNKGFIDNNAFIKEIDLKEENYAKILKIERPKYEVIEEKKELLTDEEKEFLKDMIKYYNIKTLEFSNIDVNIRDDDSIVNCPNYPDDLKFENVEKFKEYTLKVLGLEEN